MNRTMRTNAIAVIVMVRTFAMSTFPVFAIPLTIARTIIPRISSMTAAPMMILDSLTSMSFMSLMTRAVIPTLVATMAAPMNMDEYMSPSVTVMNRYPTMKGTMTPMTATRSAAFPTDVRSVTLVSNPTVNRRKMTPSSEKISRVSWTV